MPLVCPICSVGSFVLKHEATYVYSYRLDSKNPIPGSKNKVEFLPFLYDDREQKNGRQYLECTRCGARYPCYFNQWDGKVSCKTLHEAITAGTSTAKFPVESHD